jgi:hypothetical protein
VLDYLAVLKLVDIDNGKSARARLAHGMIMDNHIIAIGEDVLALAVVVRELVPQERNVALEALRPVGSVRIVLCVARSEVFRGRVEILLIECGLFECGYRLFVRLTSCSRPAARAHGIAANRVNVIVASKMRSISTSIFRAEYCFTCTKAAKVQRSEKGHTGCHR